MVKVLFTAPRDIGATPALQRMLDAQFNLGKIENTFVDWVTTPSLKLKNYQSFRWSKSKFGLVAWQIYLLYWILKIRPDVVVNMSVLSSPCIMIARILVGFRHVYDCRDYFAVSYHFSPFQTKILRAVDVWFSRQSELTIFPDEYGFKYFCTDEKKYVVVPNTVKTYGFRKMATSSRIKLGYFGYLSLDRNIVAIMDGVKQDERVELHIACNYVPEKLTDLIETCDNIIYHGKLSHKESQELMSEMDYCLIMYDPSLENYRYIQPTKYYDCLALGLPYICSKGMVSLQQNCNNDNIAQEYGTFTTSNLRKTDFLSKNFACFEIYSYERVIGMLSVEFEKVFAKVNL